MKLQTKRTIIGLLGLLFLASLVLVQALETLKKREEVGLAPVHVSIPESSRSCVTCHSLPEITPGITDHWTGSTHAKKGVGCVDCHKAKEGDADAFTHQGALIATVVTPLDCSRCHQKEYEEFDHSHHSRAGNILASLDNRLAEVVEGSQQPFNPHGATPGRPDMTGQVNGLASAMVGCWQCHGSKVALLAEDGSAISIDQLKPYKKGEEGTTKENIGQPRNVEILKLVAKTDKGQPKLHPGSWPNTGIGRLNLDGSKGSCSACHSRHDFSPRRARQPENCGKCHLGPDHPQKEIYEESKHGVAYRDLKDKMNLDSKHWVLGEDYTQAPTCATCHMSGHSQNGGKVTHDPGERLSWTNRPPISLVLDTDKDNHVVKETDPEKRRKLVTNSAMQKRKEMYKVCKHCHTENYVDAFYKQYDDFVVLYNEKFGKPGKAIMDELQTQGLITKPQFDEEIEWTWFYLWHHEGRRARHGASMMAPDYAHWHGMYEVAERFYIELIPQAQEITEHAAKEGKEKEAKAVNDLIAEILARPEHQWKNAPKEEIEKARAAAKADVEAKAKADIEAKAAEDKARAEAEKEDKEKSAQLKKKKSRQADS